MEPTIWALLTFMLAVICIVIVTGLTRKLLLRFEGIGVTETLATTLSATAGAALIVWAAVKWLF